MSMESGTLVVNEVVSMKTFVVTKVKAGCTVCRCSVADLDRHIYDEHSDKQDEKTGNFGNLRMALPDLETQELKAYKVDRVSVLKGKN